MLNHTVHVMVNAIGNMGVTIFIIISGYFGIQFRLSKIFKLWCIILFYSLFLFAYDCFQTGFSLSDITSKAFIKSLYKALTPITSNTWWFFTCYTILFMLSPLLNKAVDSMTKKQFLYLLGVLLFFYSISPTFLMHSLSNTPGGKCTENMILAYFIGRYISKYPLPPLLLHHPALIFLMCSTIIFCVNFFIFEPLYFCKDHNLFIILGALSTFVWFKSMPQPTGEKTNNIILYAATYAFPIYLLNSFIMKFEYTYSAYVNDTLFLPNLILFLTIAIITAIGIETIRRIIFDKPIAHLGNLIDKKCPKLV